MPRYRFSFLTIRVCLVRLWRVRRRSPAGSFFGQHPPMDGRVYQDLPVGLRDARACQTKTFLRAHHILFCFSGRHESPPRWSTWERLRVRSSYGASKRLHRSPVDQVTEVAGACGGRYWPLGPLANCSNCSKCSRGPGCEAGPGKRLDRFEIGRGRTPVVPRIKRT
jgi:hypothetical protein